MRMLPAAALALTMSATAVTAADPDGPVVVEFLTSQGCYSCPPAEKFLGDLAGQIAVPALEFHVNYWDDLVHGGDGKWKDVFSKREYANIRCANAVITSASADAAMSTPRKW